MFLIKRIDSVRYKKLDKSNFLYSTNIVNVFVNKYALEKLKDRENDMNKIIKHPAGYKQFNNFEELIKE